MPKKLTIVVSSLQAVGHVTGCAGALSGLLARGHRIIFVLTQMFEGKLAALGFEEHFFPADDSQFNQKMVNPGQVIAQMFQQLKIIGPYTPKEKMENMAKMLNSRVHDRDLMRMDQELKKVIELYSPDLFYIDGILMPAIYYSGIPWVCNVSVQPLIYREDEDLPPGGSGLPTQGNREEWNTWKDVRKLAIYSPAFNDLIEEIGYYRYPQDRLLPQGQVLTVCAIPEELNYSQIRKSGWFNLEVFNKTPKENVKLEKLVPSDFLSNSLDGKFSGKLIYVSMGSMGSIDLELMNRLVKVLGKTNHKFIVSTGPRHAEYQLATANMWGAEFLPQTSILPHVDLVITHGGNNTVTEVFAEGKPMIVLPLFSDQYDNAQRLQETGFGARIDPYNFTEKEFLETIEKVLNDAKLQQKLNRASVRILSTKHHEEFAIKIEQIFDK